MTGATETASFIALTKVTKWIDASYMLMTHICHTILVPLWRRTVMAWLKYTLTLK